MATASLGGYLFDIDPSTAKWSYELNTNKIETYGGTVVQILSRNIGDLSIYLQKVLLMQHDTTV